MPRPMFHRTQPATRPGPYDVVGAAQELFGQTTILLPAIEVVLASIWPCKACDGSRFDYVEASRTRDAPGKSNFIPCRVCGGEGGIFPGETIWIDHSVTELPTRTGYEIGFLSRIRSPWKLEQESFRDFPFETKLREPPTCRPHFEAMAYEVANTLLQSSTARIVAKSLQPNGPFPWPAGWRPGTGPNLAWVAESYTEIDDHL